jgi:release factor glutamine methyltransferase
VLGSLLQDIAARIKAVSDTPLLDIQVAAAEMLGVTRTWILAHPDFNLSASQVEALHAAGQRLQNGEPLPYILGHWEFYSLDFHLTPDVLIPRPETEMLVDAALHGLQTLKRAGELPLVADIGTGSGCIAVSLAANASPLHVVAVDISFAALEIARLNVRRHHLEDRVFCVQADLLPSVSKPFQLICANLPYIPTRSLDSLSVARWEPRLALWGGQDGLTWIRALMHQLNDRENILAPGALVLMEIDATLGQPVLDQAQRNFPGAQIQLLKDLAGHNRLLRVELPA